MQHSDQKAAQATATANGDAVSPTTDSEADQVDTEALLNMLAARDEAVAEALLRVDQMMMHLHEAHAERAAAEAAMVRLEFSAAAARLRAAGKFGPATLAEALNESEAALVRTTTALHSAQAEAAKHEAAVVQATAEATEQRGSAEAARRERDRLRLQLAECRAALAHALRAPDERAVALDPRPEPPKVAPAGS
jgi:hypothetical protein